MIRRRQVKHVRQYLSSSKIRKKRQRRRIWRIVLLSILLALFFTAFVFINRLPFFQMKGISVSGNILISTDMIESEVKKSIKYRSVWFGLIPDTNVFFIPEKKIETALLEAIPRIEDVGVDISFKGILNIVVAEKNMRAVWCTDKTRISCYDIDFEGNLFTRIQETVDSPYVYTGIMLDNASSSLVGKNFIAPHLIDKSERFMSYLKEKGFEPQYIDCNTELTCIAYVRAGANTRIVFDLQSDLGLVSERLNVALESNALKEKEFAYIDTRFGNKLFYKYEDDDSAVELRNTASTTATSSAGSQIEE